jgi:hypothetical protein
MHTIASRFAAQCLLDYMVYDNRSFLRVPFDTFSDFSHDSFLAIMIPFENNLQVGIILLSTFSIVLALVAVVLRLIARHMKKKIDYGDYCIIAALVRGTVRMRLA